METMMGQLQEFIGTEIEQQLQNSKENADTLNFPIEFINTTQKKIENHDQLLRELKFHSDEIHQGIYKQIDQLVEAKTAEWL